MGTKKIILLILLNLILIFVLVHFLVTNTDTKIISLSTYHDFTTSRFLFYMDRKDMSFSENQSTVFRMSILRKKHPVQFPSLKCTVLNYSSLKQLMTEQILEVPIKKNYIIDLYNVWTSLPNDYKSDSRFLVWYPFDRVERFDFPIIVKSRWNYDDNHCKQINFHPSYCAKGTSILLKLNKMRHYDDFYNLMNGNIKDTSFHKKKSKVVWRGQSTGYGFGNNIPFRPQSRESLVRLYATLPNNDPRSSFIDIGLTGKVKEEYLIYLKNTMTTEELLQHKYVISMEGNDVATNLKCFIASQSIVMMPKPRVESWFMESFLIPYRHYIPLKDDCSDVWEQFQWAESHPDECQTILTHANNHAKYFFSLKNESELEKKVLMSYLDHFTWIPDVPMK